jgi:putative flippase GtrA
MMDRSRPLSRWSLVVWYSLFALIAATGNLGIQWMVLEAYTGAYALLVALALGTLTGLVIKYLLDKGWIFRDQSSGLKTHARKFFLYSVMGLVTTAVFWGSELLFGAVFGQQWVLVGGGIGLAIGYVAKYRLDRQFVFEVAA